MSGSSDGMSVKIGMKQYRPIPEYENYIQKNFSIEALPKNQLAYSSESCLYEYLHNNTKSRFSVIMRGI